MATFISPCVVQKPSRRFCIARSAKEDESILRLRSEAEAPFRLFRLVLYGSGVAGGGIGLLVNLTQIAGSVAGRSGALSVAETIQNVAIDVAGVGICGWLAWTELKARNKQMARLSRESRLGGLSVEVANGKLLSLYDLRGTARVVVVAGTAEQIERSMTEAEEFREKLEQAGVFIVQFLVGEGSLKGIEEKDLRYSGRAVRLEEWEEWFKEQMDQSSVTFEDGLYVGLRLDGRVRASGKGTPPWFRIANELPPIEGMWSGLGDGFDGPVY